MRNGTKKPTGPWSLRITLRQEPQCPGCAEFLQPLVVEVRAGWAWCPVCAGHALHAEPHLAFILEHEAMARHATMVNGIRFYTPRSHHQRQYNALDFYEEVITADRFALTQRGEQAAEHGFTTARQ